MYCSTLRCAMCCGPAGGDAEVVTVEAAQPWDLCGEDDSHIQSPRDPLVTGAAPTLLTAPLPVVNAAEMDDKEPVMFSATLTKGTRPLGMDVNYHDSSTLLITRVKTGPCHDYNSTNRSQIIGPGDRIVSVNGVDGDPQLMLQACKAEELKLTIRRCDERRFSITRKSPEQKLGIDLEQCDTCTLVIVGLDESGDSAYAEYRRTYGLDFPALEKDLRVIGVNGVYGEAEKLEAELKRAQSWALDVRRVWPRQNEEKLQPGPASAPIVEGTAWNSVN